jgi:hypothetical protein
MHTKRVAMTQMDDERAPAKEPRTLKWWQWMLMYPTLAVTVVGAFPQYKQWIAAISIGIPVGSDVDFYRQQSEAWDRNGECLQNAAIDRLKPVSETNYAIEILACRSGDILVTMIPIQNPDAAEHRWIVTKDLVQHHAQFSLIAPAFAEAPTAPQPAPQATRVVGVTRAGDLIIRRVQLTNGTCEDQTINSYTGRLLGRKRAPCDRL